MSPQARRAPFAGTAPTYIPPASNAALLIDFDNVTVSIRGDLGKELKALLNSDVIRGKVSVQRAYADWRRYPQYIVPLAESSVDLIFAPAYGPGKKNATDLRMAIDAMELVFTRPEIGTFILLTGDSDFSSCVLKLKEYGKYVIGVGMRESSSDLLIQNCDEYYSYHALSGLTRTRENEESREDPWELVRRAAEQMAARRDSMRADRLKQVMLELDPAFDEGKLGYSKFTRFVTEAADKGLLRLRKGEGGQYEIVVDGGAPEESVSAEEREPARERERPRRNGRGRDRDRAPRPAPVPLAAEAEEPQASAAPAAPVPAVAATDVGEQEGAYALLQHTVRDMLGSNRSGAVRDGDVKRRMLDQASNFDETQLGFSKFTRFLRQAHDDQVIDLRQVGDGAYEVALPASGKRLPAPVLVAAPQAQAASEAPTLEAAPSRPGRGRGRRGGRPEAGPPPVLPGQLADGAAPESTPAPAPEPEASTPAPAPEPTPADTAPQPVSTLPATAAAIPARTGVRGRRGGLGRAVGSEGPPPLLPGQVIAPPALSVREEEAPAPAPAEQPAAPEAAMSPEESESAEPSAKRRRSRGGRGRSRKQAEPSPTDAAPQSESEASTEQEDQPIAEAAPAAADAPTADEESEASPKRRRSRGGRGRSRGTAEPADQPAAEATPEAASAEPSPPQPAGDDLPTDRAGIEAYLTGRFKGVGKKTVDALHGAFGDDVLRIMDSNPERIRRTVEGRRIDTLLREFADARRAESEPVAEAAPADENAEAGETPAKRRRSRGGRGRSRKKTESATGE